MWSKTFDLLPDKNPTETIEGDEKPAQHKQVAQLTSRLCCCWMLAVDFGCHSADGCGFCCMIDDPQGEKPTSYLPSTVRHGKSNQESVRKPKETILHIIIDPLRGNHTSGRGGNTVDRN